MPKTAPKVLEISTWQEGIVPLALVIGWAGITAILSFLFFQAMDVTRMRVRATHDVLISLKDFLSSALDAETGQRGYLITQNDSYLVPYKDGLEKAQLHIRRLEALGGGGSEPRSRLTELRNLWQEKSQELTMMINIAKEVDIETARAAVGNNRGKIVMDQIRDIVSGLEAKTMATRAEAIAEQDVLIRRLFTYTQLTTLTGLVALLYLLSQARGVAAQLRIEVANRHSADELSQERTEQALRVRVMNRELVHRTKNLISVVQAIVRNQEKSSPEIDRFVAVLSRRLTSLGSTLDILVRENWSEVRLEDLIAGQLRHFSEDIARRIAVAPGPPIKFTASEAQMLGLALHELGTNAAKYGALSDTRGRVDISWREENTDKGAVIALFWKEDGGPLVEAPARHGFGSRITKSLVARSVGGTAVIDYSPSGLTWTLTFARDRHTGPDSDEAPELGSVLK